MEEVRRMVSEKEPVDGNKTKIFRSGLFGFSKKEVEEFIAAADTAKKAEAEAYEKKLAEQSAALAMALREKEKLTEQNTVMSEKLEILSSDIGGKQSEIAAENYILKARISDLSDVEGKNAILISEINDIRSRFENSESEKKELQLTLGEKEEIIIEQCRKYSEIEKNLKLEIERIKAETEHKVQVYELKIATAQDNLRKALNILERI